MDCRIVRQQTYFNMHNLHRVRHLLHELQMLKRVGVSFKWWRDGGFRCALHHSTRKFNKLLQRYCLWPRLRVNAGVMQLRLSEHAGDAIAQYFAPL